MNLFNLRCLLRKEEERKLVDDCMFFDVFDGQYIGFVRYFLVHFSGVELEYFAG
jgi:hypothetical protein